MLSRVATKTTKRSQLMNMVTELLIMDTITNELHSLAFTGLTAMPFNKSFNSQPKAYLLPFTYAYG